MTKFILHGGNTSVENKDNEAFFSEFTKDFLVEKKISILLVYFAKDESKWSDLAKQDVDKISKISKRKSIHFEIAREGKFEEQIKSADVIYFRGGDTYKLLEKLKKIEKLKTLLLGKTIAGSSAGVCVLGKYFYDNDYDKFDEGLGVINYKIFCHYDESSLELVKKLDEYKEKLKILKIPQYKHKIICKSDNI